MYTAERVLHTVENLVKEAIEKAFPEAEMPAFLVEAPKADAHGDFSTNAAMLLTKALRRAPRDIAAAILENLPANALVERTEVAGPGFINFYLNPGWIYGTLADIEERGENFGRVEDGNGKSVMVEFVSANPTGPMHMGNARGGAIGDSLAALLDMAGWRVSREFYLNDAGAQIEKFGMSLEARFLQILTGKEDFPEDGYQGADITELAQAYIDENGSALLEKESADRRRALVEYALPKNIDKMQKDLEKYRIRYDTWYRESSLYASGEVEETIALLGEKGLTYEKENAIWFKSTRFGAEKDDVLVRANGIPTYFAADIAYHRNKLAGRNFDMAINIWGADHHGHIARMKGAMEALGIDPARLHVITMQLVRLVENGEVVRMSKRTGKMITLSDLLDEIGVDAARFFFNLRQAGSHFEFDLGLAVEQSNDNPVFYVQYAYARICSILRLLAEEGTSVRPFAEIDASILSDEHERALIKKLADFPEEIRVAASALEPSRITRYAMDTAALFHSFYNACHVRTEDAAVTAARLKLVESTRTVLGNALRMLAVTAPEKM
ncbi:MAG: arginine--tRNA ligase [Clostridia bacterium]|nr:arginine--tRNA ligase [Oscillospiraceae bacterium]MBQ7033309.1 arginine--tRNA ligase [Clostridia bacterium]